MAISLLGALLILFGFLLINNKLTYPGYWALIPTVGSIMIIGAGNEAWLNRTLLQNKL